MALIELDDVSKSFVVRTAAGRLRRRRELVTAVDHVSFTVDAGAMVGYIGPNGAHLPGAGRVRFNRQDHTAASVLDAVTRAETVRDIALEEPSIEEIVRHIYGREPA
jgi:ABC-type uncharacterized transport system ATPase subunit